MNTEDKIKKSIANYYKKLNIYEDINYQKILIFCDNYKDEKIEIYLSINFEEKSFKILIYNNNHLIKEINFDEAENFYFFFLKNISEDYFIRNISFYTNNNLEMKILLKDNYLEKFRKKENEMFF